MSWEEFIGYILANSTKIDKIAVFDSKGRPVAITDDIETCDSEGFALVKCMQDCSQIVTRLNVDNDIFQCYHGIDQTLIGRKMKDSSCLLIARQEGEEIIVFIGYPEGAESFLEHMKDGLQRKAEGTLTTQLDEPGALVSISTTPASMIGTPNITKAEGPSAVTTDEVLVDIVG